MNTPEAIIISQLPLLVIGIVFLLEMIKIRKIMERLAKGKK